MEDQVLLFINWFNLSWVVVRVEWFLKSTQKNLFDIFKGFTWNKICSFFKAKNEEKLEKYFLKLFLGQKPFSSFLKNKTKY